MAEELQKTPPAGAMARPDFLKQGDTRGTEAITKDEIQMPRLALAQGLSKQIEEGHPLYIEGLKVGNMFNNLTRDIYGKGPLSFTILRIDRPRYVEFNPRTEGGGVKDINVPANDPRTQFRRGPAGESMPPIATKFLDFIVAMLPLKSNPMDSVIALSFKSTGLKVGRQLNGLVKLRNAPVFAGRYAVGVAQETNAKGTFFNYSVRNDGWVDEQTYKVCGEMFEALKDVAVVIEREPGDETPEDVAEDVKFDPDKM